MQILHCSPFFCKTTVSPPTAPKARHVPLEWASFSSLSRRSMSPLPVATDDAEPAGRRIRPFGSAAAVAPFTKRSFALWMVLPPPPGVLRLPVPCDMTAMQLRPRKTPRPNHRRDVVGVATYSSTYFVALSSIRSWSCSSFTCANGGAIVVTCVRFAAAAAHSASRCGQNTVSRSGAGEFQSVECDDAVAFQSYR